MTDWPDLTRTAAAVDDYDAACLASDATYTDDLDLDAVDAGHAAKERARAAVGVAFAEDTADRNPPDTARLVRPGPWLRGLIARWRQIASVPVCGP